MDTDYTQVIDLPLSSRAMIVGTSGSGKSTLAELMVARQLKKYPNMQQLYIDSKPRFRAEFELNGLGTKVSKRYKKWARDYGTFIPGSYVLPLTGDIGNELDQVWRLGGKIAIAQASTPDEWSSLMIAAQEFYKASHGKVERLVYINEMSDFFEVKKIGGIFWLIARSGREKKVALIAETQRPVYIPRVLLSEMKRLYLFELDNEDDMDTIYKNGIPRDIEQVKKEFVFLFWDKKLKKRLPSGQYYTLKGITK